MRGGPLIRDFRELFRTEKARAAHRYVRFSCPSQPSSERIVRGLPFGEIKAAAARLAKRWKCGTVEVQVARERRASPHVPVFAVFAEGMLVRTPGGTE